MNMNFPMKGTGATYNKLYCRKPIQIDSDDFFCEVYDTTAGIVLTINPKSAKNNNREKMIEYARQAITYFYRVIVHEE